MGEGEDSGKENVSKEKTEEVLYMLHPTACISEQEGLVLTFQGRPKPGTHISWVGGLPCSSEKEERRERSFYF